MTIRLVCQRCLGAVSVPLDAPVALALVRDAAQAEALPDHLDPMEVEEGRIRPLDLVEDELLLAIPQVPMHPPGRCAELYEPAADADQGVEVPGPENPFAVLAHMKRPASER
ncbi:MAG: YceD family protein [Chromatiaceae bacterium]